MLQWSLLLFKASLGEVEGHFQLGTCRLVRFCHLYPIRRCIQEKVSRVAWLIGLLQSCSPSHVDSTRYLNAVHVVTTVQNNSS